MLPSPDGTFHLSTFAMFAAILIVSDSSLAALIPSSEVCVLEDQWNDAQVRTFRGAGGNQPPQHGSTLPLACQKTPPCDAGGHLPGDEPIYILSCTSSTDLRRSLHHLRSSSRYVLLGSPFQTEHL